jgi:hypothetical protein
MLTAMRIGFYVGMCMMCIKSCMEEVGAEKMKFALEGGYESEYSSMHIQFY